VKKKLYALAVSFALLALPMAALAGVQGSDHDLTGGGQKLCEACHTPHNALGDNLWASTPGGTFSGVQDLCFTCHDGGVTSVGVTTAFDENKEQHAIVGADCSGAGACHDVHNQNPNLTGRFTVAGVVETNNSYCETCHDATMFTGAEGLGDHTAGITHFTDGVSFTCNQCHTVHGATPQTANPFGLTNPILLADNHDGTNYGVFCASCHNGGTPSEAVPGTGGQTTGDPFDYLEPTNGGTEQKHPTTTAAVGGCDHCHDVHDPTGTAYGYLLIEDNANSAYCISCHAGGGAPTVGANSHYIGVPSNTGMNTGLTPPLPWADQIDEDAATANTPDWAGVATANMMVCETCHSVHRKGNTGPDAQYFLREENGDANQLCTACHTAN
jgi:predicted CXXCH cytochrome family protein